MIKQPRTQQTQEVKPLRKVVKPHVFSNLIATHGSILQEENHRTIVPHQILNPYYNPVNPKLKVDIESIKSSNDSVSSYSPSSTQSSRIKNSITNSSQRSNKSASQSSTAARLTMVDLEQQLIEESANLKKLQLESDAVSFNISYY
jgi:hypothetical protein